MWPHDWILTQIVHKEIMAGAENATLGDEYSKTLDNDTSWPFQIDSRVSINGEKYFWLVVWLLVLQMA